MEQYPDYLFASATLLQVLLDQDRIPEAEELCKILRPPPEVHPSALLCWLNASGDLALALGKEAELVNLVKMGLEIDPDHPGLLAKAEALRSHGLL
jgi:hypothetical protein